MLGTQQYLLPLIPSSAHDEHTPGHLNCPVCERMKLGHAEQLSGDMTFHDAFEAWIGKMVMHHETLVSDAHYISERTEWDYRQYYRALEKFFGALRLGEIHTGHLHVYQQKRAFKDGPWDRQAGANRIRKEVDMLTRMMREVGTYTDDIRKKQHRRLRLVESDIPRAMAPDEQTRWLTKAASSDRFSLIHQYSIAGLQTTMSTNEMRGLLIGDISLYQRTVQVRMANAKNRYRIRTIPLETQEVLWAFEALIWRAKELGAGGPHHYLFPFRETLNKFDPTRQMSDSGLKKRWQEVREAAELPWLRPYDLRHSGITRMAEAGTPIAVIMSFAGHMTLQMQQHYTAISMSSMRKHAASTWGTGVPAPMGLVPARMAMGEPH
jgi:integrase